MPKTKPYFPPHYVDVDGYAADLERELAGYRAKVKEWKAQGAEDGDSVIVEAMSGVEAVLAELKRIGHGHEQASKRPAKAAEKR